MNSYESNKKNVRHEIKTLQKGVRALTTLLMYCFDPKDNELIV